MNNDNYDDHDNEDPYVNYQDSRIDQHDHN